MIEILPCSSIFFNFHLHDEHDFGSFPIYVGFAEAIWTCDGKWVGSNIRNSSLNEYAGKKYPEPSEIYNFEDQNYETSQE